MDGMKGGGAVDTMLEVYHGRTPIRAWSLIVTLYGDAIVPRGGSLWLGSLIEIMEAFRIDAGVVRTAMSRLAADGWLERTRIGRNSYYRLSRRGRTGFLEAARRIYAVPTARWGGRWHVATILGEPGERGSTRQLLTERGFMALAPNVLIAPLCEADDGGRTLALDGEPVIIMEAAGGTPDEARRLAAETWKLEPLELGYRRLATLFEALRERLALEPLDGRDALVLRTLVIHEYRRVMLHDPLLPAELLPPGWPGHLVRALCADIYRKVAGPADTWLGDNARNEAGPLPEPDAVFRTRFGGL
ncbi:MAG: PaaX family transcriptional regulator C-terminal domain-containing protein [Hyphomicrobiales bacterium]